MCHSTDSAYERELCLLPLTVVVILALLLPPDVSTLRKQFRLKQLLLGMAILVR